MGGARERQCKMPWKVKDRQRKMQWNGKESSATGCGRSRKGSATGCGKLRTQCKMQWPRKDGAKCSGGSRKGSRQAADVHGQAAMSHLQDPTDDHRTARRLCCPVRAVEVLPVRRHLDQKERRRQGTAVQRQLGGQGNSSAQAANHLDRGAEGLADEAGGEGGVGVRPHQMAKDCAELQ